MSVPSSASLDTVVRQLGYWWNGSWGAMTSRKIWLEVDPARRCYILRWRGGDFRDRDGQLVTADGVAVLGALHELLGADWTVWKYTGPDNLDLEEG